MAQTKFMNPSLDTVAHLGTPRQSLQLEAIGLSSP